MKHNNNQLTTLLACTTLLASCGGTKTSNNSSFSSIESTNNGESLSSKEGIKLLDEMGEYIDNNLDFIRGEEPPAGFTYLYIESLSDEIVGNDKLEGKSITYFSMKVGERLLYSIQEYKTGETRDVQESYVVETRNSEWASWDVDNGIASPVNPSSTYSANIILGYAYNLSTTFPSYTSDLIAERNTTPVSFTKYSDVDLDVTYEVDMTMGNADSSDEINYVKEVVTTTFRNRFATSTTVDRYDENSKAVYHKSTVFKFEKTDFNIEVPK